MTRAKHRIVFCEDLAILKQVSSKVSAVTSTDDGNLAVSEVILVLSEGNKDKFMEDFRRFTGQGQIDTVHVYYDGSIENPKSIWEIMWNLICFQMSEPKRLRLMRTMSHFV